MKEYFENILLNHNFKLEMHIGLRRGDEFVPLEYEYEIESGVVKKLNKKKAIEVRDRHLLINFVSLGKAKDQILKEEYEGVEVVNVVVDDKAGDVE